MTERSRVRHKLSCSQCTCDSLPMCERRRGNAQFSNPEANLHASYRSYRIKVIVSVREREREKGENKKFYILFFIINYLLRYAYACLIGLQKETRKFLFLYKSNKTHYTRAGTVSVCTARIMIKKLYKNIFCSYTY